MERGVPPGTNVTADPFHGQREARATGEDFDLYDSVSVNVTGTGAECLPSLTTFQDMFDRFSDKIPKTLHDNMKQCGFVRPTPVQKYAIPAGLEGRDVMCSAQTGSGKTAAFLIPMLASMIKNHHAIGDLETPFTGPCKPDTLIFSPTRELCIQTYEDALRFCYQTSHRCTRVYGQESAKRQIAELAKGADLIVATVGRLYDFVKAGIINVEEVNCLVLDEADRMLDMGFEVQIKEIVEDHNMPGKDSRQTMMFSATFPEEVQNAAQSYLHDHLMVVVGKKGSPAVTVAQMVEKVEKDQKKERLIEYLDSLFHKDSNHRVLVFTNSKKTAMYLDEQLWNMNVAKTAAIHGDLDQSKREESLTKFREGNAQVLIATDLASRGLDISGVSFVINYDAPKEIATYVHRIGRTGRIGHRGTAMTFVTMEGCWCHDTDEFLRELPAMMQKAPNTEIPPWLAELSEQKNNDTWYSKKNDWQTTDVRYEKTDNTTFDGWDVKEEDQNQNNGGWNSTTWKSDTTSTGASGDQQWWS